MAKSKLPNRLINFALFALAFMRPLSLLIRSPSIGSLNTIVSEATFGIVTADGSKGKFDVASGARMYAPIAAAFVLFEVKKMAMKKFRF